MAEIFGRNSEQNFRNMVDDPFLKKFATNGRVNSHKNCCGLAATGDVEEEAPAPVEIKSKVQSIKAWHYAKTALALVGLYVIVKFAYDKYAKK